MITPIYLKSSKDMPWPENESVFYLLSRDGLFLCRNHDYFRSSVPAKRAPSELAAHGKHIRLNYPKLPRLLFEQVVGFFERIADLHSAEAAALIVHDTRSGEVGVLIPDQVATVSRSWWSQHLYPLDVRYEVPDLPPHLVPIGDIHCHVDGPAYASYTDVQDEVHRPGVHMVVGRIHREPPELHIEVTVDGHRFLVEDHRQVIEGYHSRRCAEVPVEWLDKVTVEVLGGASAYDDGTDAAADTDGAET